MINLLPEKEKRVLSIEQIWRKVFLCLVFSLVFLAFLILILFFLRTYIYSEASSLKDIVLEKEAELGASEFQGFKKTIEGANQNFSRTKKFWQDQIFITPVFEKLSALTQETIYFTSFSFKKIFQEKKTDGRKEEIFAEIYISGWAQNRESLFLFKNNLEREGSFQEVNFSLESWVRPTNVNFSLSLRFNPLTAK